MSPNRQLKTIFLILYYFLAQHLPISYHYGYLGKIAKITRAFICKQIFQYCGREVNIEKGLYFGTGTGVNIGDFSGIGINCQMPETIAIGKYVMMGPNVTIYSQNHEFYDLDKPMMFQGYKEISPVVIEDDVWIGGHVIILPGVRIGKGSIIGAGAVVATNIAPYSICVGNPAKVIKSRLDRGNKKNL